MDCKLKTMLLAKTRTQLKDIFDDEGIGMVDLKFRETDLDDGLCDIFSRFMADQDDDREYNRLERESKALVKGEFNRVMGEIQKAKFIIDNALNG